MRIRNTFQWRGSPPSILEICSSLDTNLEAISTRCEDGVLDGVLTITVPKVPPPDPQNPKTAWSFLDGCMS